MPARDLETKLVQITNATLKDPGFCANIVTGLNASERKRCSSLPGEQTDKGRKQILEFIERIDLAPGTLKIKLSARQLANRLNRNQDEPDARHLTFKTPFQLRKRGVETRIIIADAPIGLDEALIRNIAKANHWYGLVKQGQTFKQIAQSQNTSSDRIQKMIGLAFLAPDLLRQVMEGTQPLGFTSDRAMRRGIPSDWTEQRARFATL